MGIIYKATSPSGKVYIGQTIKTISRRKDEHYSSAFRKNNNIYINNYKISKAIRKYDDTIKWAILHYDVAINSLDKLEKEEIKKHNSFKSGYNSTEGGGGCSGWSPSKETRKKISESNMGKKHSAEARKKISNASRGNKNMLGKHHSEESREKISKANSGKNNGRAKLNYEIVQEIKIKYRTGKYTHKQLSKEYNVGQTTIGNAINNLLWNK